MFSYRLVILGTKVLIINILHLIFFFFWRLSHNNTWSETGSGSTFSVDDEDSLFGSQCRKDVIFGVKMLMFSSIRRFYWKKNHFDFNLKASKCVWQRLTYFWDFRKVIHPVGQTYSIKFWSYSPILRISLRTY